MTPANSGVSAAISRIASCGPVEAHVVPERPRDVAQDVEVGARVARRRRSRRRTSWMRRSAFVNVPVFSRNAEAGQDDVGVVRRLGLEDVLADEEVERLERVDDVRRVRVGLRDVLAEDVHRLQRAGDRRVEHLRDLQPRAARQRDAPARLERLRDLLVVDPPVAGVGVGQRAHVGRALDVVLPAQRQQRRAGAPDLPGHQRERADQLRDLRAVLVLGDAQAPQDATPRRPRRRRARRARGRRRGRR